MGNSNFRSKNVLITGGLGFIGSNLAHRLVKLGAHVTLLDSLIPEYGGNLYNIKGVEDRVTTNISDVRDEFGMNYLIQDQDYLFNLAGQTSHLDSMENPFTDLEINCKSQLAILEACRNHNPEVKIVFASTRQIYGKPQYLPVDETHPLVPVDVNGINKISAEMYHMLYCRVYGIKATALRLTNTYGPRMRIKDARQTFLGIWIRLILEEKTIQVFGDGQQLRDFNYVDDTVEALLMAVVSPDAIGHVFNLGGDERITLKDLAELVVQCNGKGKYKLAPFPKNRKAIDIGDYYSDDSLFRKTTGWKPNVPLKEGLKRTLAYYREDFSHYV